MSDTTAGPQNESLDVGRIVGEAFAAVKGNIVAVLILGGVPAIISLLLTWGLLGAAFVTGDFNEDSVNIPPGFFVSAFLLGLITFAIYGVALALFVQMAYDFKLGQPIQPARYVQPALASVVYIVLLTIIIAIPATIGFMFFIVPGLWVYAVFSVAIPAVVIERAGFGALGRSISLTKNYRWPIVLLMIVCGIITIVITTVGSLLAEIVPGGMIIDLIVFTLLYAITYGIFGIVMFLTYARLREIKEGFGVSDLVSVFE